MAEMSKSEKERIVDEKIRAMREKNAMAVQRKLIVDKDKQLAEINRSSITSVSKLKTELDDQYTPPADRTPKPKQRIRSEEKVDSNRREPPKRGGGRMGDVDGPPPDPGYRFLADRMREDEDDERKGRDGLPLKRGGGGARVGRPGREAKSMTGRTEDRISRKESEEDDDIMIVLEKDKHGRVQNHLSPLMSRTEERRALAMPGSHERKSSASYTNSKPSSSKIKSLFDDDDEFRGYPRKERWKEDLPKVMSSPRKIDTQGGSLTITRTVDNMTISTGSDSYQEPFQQAPQRDRNENTVRSYKNSFSSSDEERVFSENKWQCSDPSCRMVNLSGTTQCSKCKLAYVKSHEYKNNHACDKYKQEFNSRKPKAALPPPPFSSNVNQPVPQPLFQPVPNMGEWTPEPIEMIPYTSDWNAQTMGMNNWAMPQEVMMPQQYGVMVNPVQIPGFVPPMVQTFYGPRTLAPTPQYYSQHEYVGNHFPAGPEFSYQPPAAASHFNPSAQTFVPTSDTLPSSLFQSPPPMITSNHPPPMQTSRPPPPVHSVMKHDPNLLISLKTPPKPLAFNRNQEPRKPFIEKNNRSFDESPLSSRLSEKNKFPPRFNKSKDNSYKPPSMIEMQSGSLKKGSIAPPPANKGQGLLVFGTSNVVNHLDTAVLSNTLKLPVRLVPAMKLETFEEKAMDVNPARDWLVLIHGLGNDARNIALKRKTDQEKANEADDVANAFCDVIERKILTVSTHIYVLISMLLPRCDFSERSGMSNPNNVRKVINVQITSRLYENSRVALINSDSILCWDDEERRKELMQSDGYHLTQLGFHLMTLNWSKVISTHINLTSTTAQSSSSSFAPAPSSSSPLTPPPSISSPFPPAPSSSSPSTGSPTPSKNSCEVVSSVAVETVPDPFGTYSAPTDVLSPNPLLEGQDVDLDSDGEEWNDEAIPALETVSKPPPPVSFKLGGQQPAAQDHLNAGLANGGGEGFIEDDYCGNEPRLSDPLPSINLLLSGPESIDVGPVSGHFLEDSYLPPTIETLSICEEDRTGDDKVSLNHELNHIEIRLLSDDSGLNQADLSDEDFKGSIVQTNLIHSNDLLKSKATNLIENIAPKPTAELS